MATNLGIASLADKLRLAASKGQFEKVDELLRAGANTYDTDNEGRSALHLACYHGYPDVTQILLDAGSDVNAQDHMGYTPLHRAASQGHREIINILLARACLLDLQDRVHGNAPIHEAAWNGFSESLDILIKAKARIFLTNKSGFTALHLASQNGHNQSARVLLYGNANADMKNNYGDTPIHTAARYGHAGVTRILMSARARINEQNKNGDTALHIAAALKRRKITKLVVEAGIDPNIRNKQGETAVDVARRKDHSEVIQLILQPKARRRGKKDDLDGTRTISMTMSDPDLMEDKAPEEKETKKAKFPFFRKKKKSKAKEKLSPDPTPSQRVPPQGGSGQTPSPHQTSPAAQGQQGQPGQRGRPTVGFFNQYVPRPGVQYYRDLAGNIKQGPVGFAPVCQCTPALKQFEQKIENDNRNVYNHVEVARKMLTERIDVLDHRGQQQMFQVGGMFEEEDEACRERIHQRSLEERQYQEQFVEDYSDGLKNELKTWTADRMKSLERRVVKGHHHDDADWTHGRPHKSGGMVQSLNYDNIVQGRLYRARSDETLSVSEYNQKQKTEREMAHQVALRELRAMQRSRAARDDRRKDRRPPPRKEPAMVKVQFEHDNMRRAQSAGRELVVGTEQVPDMIHRSQSAGREILSGREQVADMMHRSQSAGREPMHQMAQERERERVPGRRDYVQVKPHPDQFRRGSFPDQFVRRGSNSDQFARREANPPRDRIPVREHGLSRDQYMRNNTPPREHPQWRDMPPKNEKHFNQERISDGQEQKFAPLRTSPDGRNFRPTSFSEGTTSSDQQMINRTGFYSPRKTHSQDELSPKKNQGLEVRPDISAISSPNVSSPPNVPPKSLDPNLLQRFEKLDTNGNVHGLHPRQGLPYSNRDNYYDNRSPGLIQEKTVARAPPVVSDGYKSDPNLLDVTKQNTSFNKDSSFRDNSYNNGYKNISPNKNGSYHGANSSRNSNSNYSDSLNNSGNYYHVQHSTANYDVHNHSGSEPSYAYIVPKQHQKTDSGSNPDSGYSSKIYGGKVQPTPRQNGSGSPNTPGSTCSTGHNISSITSTSVSTDHSFPSAHSSPVSCASDNESNQRQYYERVSQEMNRYYQRRGVPQHSPARDDGRLQFVNPGPKPIIERKLEPVTATDV